MPRLIDADDLLMDNSWAFYDENGNRNDACIAVENAPTVDAEPVRHGHWIGKPIAGYATVRCSVCGNVFRENAGRWNYCSNCGAKMDEKRREDGQID